MFYIFFLRQNLLSGSVLGFFYREKNIVMHVFVNRCNEYTDMYEFLTVLFSWLIYENIQNFFFLQSVCSIGM